MEVPCDKFAEEDGFPVLDKNDQVCMNPDENALAEELQIQEVIIFCINSERTCVLCEQVMPSLTRANCGHDFCITCLRCQAGAELKEAMPAMVKCPLANCKGTLDLESYREIIVQLEAIVTEPGESSTAAAQRGNLEFYCGICMDVVPTSERFRISSCDHFYCNSCVSQYLAAKIEETNVSIGCPDPTCKDGALELESCRTILSSDVLERWGVALCEMELGSKKFYCPFGDCSALLVNDGGDADGREAVITDAECPHCKRICCAQCKVPWHDGIGCEEFQKLGEDERGKDDLMLRKVAAESKWQRCPQCKIYVEKTDGCVFINCRCGYCFCYLCASPMSKDNHTCQKCMRVW